MYKTKGFIIGATLLALVLLPGLACAPEIMSPSLNTTKSDIPNYLTYNDESGIFSIDYPEGWEAGRWNLEEFGYETTAKEGLNRLKSGLPIQNHYTIFAAFKWVQNHIVASVFIYLDGVFMGNPHYSIDEEIESRTRTHPDFKELSRTQTTVDGREATIWAWEGTFVEAHEQAPSYHLEQYLKTDKAIWVVRCSVDSDNATEWQNEFETIVRSLRIYY